MAKLAFVDSVASIWHAHTFWKLVTRCMRWTTSSGKSRSVASYATERRSLEHDSDQTKHCHHANKLAMLLATI